MGMDFVDPLVFNIRIFIFGAICSVSFVITFENIFRSKDLKKIVEIALFGLIIVQGLSRVACHFFDFETVSELHTAALKLYEEPEKSKKLESVLRNCLKLTWRISKLLFLFDLVSLSIPFIVCYARFLLFGEMETPFPIYLVFTDITSHRGYLVNIAYQLVLSILGICAYYATDGAYLFVTLQIKAFVDCFKCSIDELEDELTNSLTNVVKISSLMRNVVEKHHDIQNYHKLIAKRLNTVFLIIILFNTYIFCFCGVAILINHYYSAFGLACVVLTELFFICIIGTFVNHQHEKLMEFLWNFNWYKLPKPEQKNFLLLLANAQNVLNLNPTFIGEVNMELFIWVSL